MIGQEGVLFQLIRLIDRSLSHRRRFTALADAPSFTQRSSFLVLPVVCWDKIYDLRSLQIGLLDRRKYAGSTPGKRG
jgi:hypothetical protein